jgi:type IV pilus assembly protein PilB
MPMSEPPDHVEDKLTSSDRPRHLRPVSQGQAAANELPQEGIPGLTPPRQRGGSNRFITDVIVELGYASPETVERVIGAARNAGRPPEELLLDESVIDADQLARATAERYGLDHVDLAEYQIDMAAANLVSVAAARRHAAIPIGYAGDEKLLVAVADPANVLALDDIQMATGLDCEAAVASLEDIGDLLGRLSTLQSAVHEAVETTDDEEELAQLTDLRASAEDAPVIKLVYSVLGQAVNEGASDIHFEPQEDELRVRFRVDGVLYEAARVPNRMVQGVVSRVKIMSDLDIAEKRVPQDGRVGVEVDGRRIDLRVTTLPTQRGEGVTIRILDRDTAMLSLDDLGMDGVARERFEHSFRQAYGAVLVTGPTGSGKSTTLYAAIDLLNQVEKKIITIEDPVEYRVAGVNQMNVQRKAGLTFANGLRSILRADPDIIMVGEIRDAETARISIEAALTGHMVLTTLHTNDAPGAITRLTEMGVEPFLTASAVDCIVAQRLARRLCTHCKRRVVLSQASLVESGFRVGADVEAYEPVGCGRCNSSGYRGRVGIYSVLVMTERIKEMTVARASEAEIEAVAREEGLLSLREDGFSKIRAGLTSIEEIVRVST